MATHLTLWEELRARVEASQLVTRAPAWAAPVPIDFRPLKVIAFDPSLTSTGWVFLRVSRITKTETRLILVSKGTLRVRAEQDGYLGTYEKASRMKALIEETLWREVDARFPPAIAWEAPAVRGHRLESSLIAGFLVYEASHRAGSPVSANHASWQLTGDPSHGKREIAAAVARYFPSSAGRTWNEHERDAMAIALSVSLDAPERPWVDDDELIY
jgi:hypothetical protein